MLCKLHQKSVMSTEATSFATSSSNHRSYRCYNCNNAFHITTSAVSSSFRCPRCFHRHPLTNYTISNSTPPPPQPNLTTTNSIITIYSTDSDSDSDSDFSDSEDFTFESFNNNNSTAQFRTLKSFIDSLPSVKVQESLKTCSVCMDEFEMNSSASQLPCNHLFHNDCIVPWLIRSNTCPLCRYKLPQEQDKELDNNNDVMVPMVRFVSSIGFGENDEWDLEEIHDEDGDVLMVDAL